ncbi:hypothetical protein ASPFODRAFT_51990 [Aspergillus luchuensis CBS 106.47]|uniref:Uncharacterized protein n=1 Tax=Aspergillus luchuensis (strain CBS 106.47) TaxID=1137211 RepID=A0A1M3T4E3_ASPLC|nr:hypothetical protein ASPFODRAFT_51990 [Aspergillus luchuensis CBS 106.47]
MVSSIRPSTEPCVNADQCSVAVQLLTVDHGPETIPERENRVFDPLKLWSGPFEVPVEFMKTRVRSVCFGFSLVAIYASARLSFDRCLGCE